MLPFLKQIGFREDNVHFVPISAYQGINLSKNPDCSVALTDWYSGATLLEILDKFKLPKRNTNKPSRVCVYDFYKATEGNIIGDCIQAKIESGIIKERD